MKGFIQVRADVAGYGDHVQVLVNPRSIELVVRTSWGCEIQLPSRILQVTDAYEDVIARIEAAEAEGSRKPGDRPLMGTAARERQGEASNSAIGQSWEEVQRELFTSEEIEESNRRVARIAARLKGKPGDG